MGASCCCLRPEDIEDLAYINGSVYRHCAFLRCLMHQLLHMYTSFFDHGEMHALTSSTQGTASLTASGEISDSSNNLFPDVNRSLPRPLPYDVDPRFSRLQCGGLVSSHEKGSHYFNTEAESLGRTGSCSGIVSVPEKQSKVDHLTSSEKHFLAKLACGVIYQSSEDEDVCPTCLEEYTPEDPKIVTQCSHHFHLGCIYEWMERSDNCPVCGKEMVFNEST